MSSFDAERNPDLRKKYFWYHGHLFAEARDGKEAECATVNLIKCFFMPERDPLGKEGIIGNQEAFDRDRYSVGVSHEQSEIPVHGLSTEYTLEKEKEQNKAFKKKKTRAWVIGGLAVSAIIALLAIAYGFSWYRANVFKNENVKVSLEGPESVSGENTERFVLVYENQNGVALQSAVVLLRFPENFIPEEKNGLKRDGTTSARVELGTVGKHQKSTLEIYGYFSGTIQSSMYIRAVLQYSPKNISGSFQRETQKSIAMNASVVGMDMTLPLELATGDLAEIAIHYTNRGKDTLFSPRLKVDYPEGFSFQEADARPSEGENIWYVDSLEPGETRTFKLRGWIEGDRGTEKKFTSVVGVVRGDGSFLTYGRDERKVQMVGSPFVLRAKVEGGDVKTVSLGTEVKCTLEYVNEGNVGLSNAVITVVLDGRIFYDAGIKVERGSYNATTRTITWRASDVPELAFVDPNESGSVIFSVPVSGTIPIVTVNDTQLKGSIRASIDSIDIPDRIGTRRIVAQDRVEVSLNTATTLHIDVRDVENHSLSEVPFQVGKETELVVYVRLRNTYNDVMDGRFVLHIPSGASFVERIFLEGNEAVSYDDRSQRLVWEVGRVKATTGILLPDRVIAFRMRVTPQEYQADDEFTLLNGIEFHGKDDFTGEPVVSVQGDVLASFYSLEGR